MGLISNTAGLWSPFMFSSLRLYPSDLSDHEWEILAPLIPPAKPGGRRRKWPMRKILNATFYLLRSGCQWRMLPREFPPWSTVHHYFRLWRLDGTWEKIHAVLRERMRARRSQSPTECWHPRHPICEDHQRGRYSRLRWGQEAQRKKAPFAGGYAGYGAKSQGALGGAARSCSGASGAGGGGPRVPSP
jgi:transposase